MVQQAGGTVQAALRRMAEVGIPAVQLDATLSGIRPRELSPRTRKDLAALIQRQGLRLAGLDLFIPRSHYLESDRQDRAINAALAAIELAADLGRVPLSLRLPVGQMERALLGVLVEAADGHGTVLTVHAEDQVEDLLTWLDEVDHSLVGAALDPTVPLAASSDPSVVAQQIASRLIVARIGDLVAPGSADAAAASARCPIGEGDLDVMAYRVSVDLASRRCGPVVLDLRGLIDPIGASQIGSKAWHNATMIL